MAYRPDDPYNTSLRNINQGQNMQMAELTDKQKKFIDQKKFPLQEGLISPSSVYETITNPDLGVYDTGIFGIGAQEPTTKDEYNEYLKSIGISGQVSSLDDDEYDFSGIEGQTAGLQWLVPAAKEYWKKKMLANMALEGTGILRKIGKDYIKKKKKKTSTTTSGGQKIITKKKKTSAPPGEKGGPGYIPPKHKPSHQTGGSGGVHSGMKTTKTSAPQRDYSKHSAYGLKQGGLVNFFKYGGFLG
jgi:hypothetical protein